MWNVNPSKDEIGLLMEAGIIYRDLRNFSAAREIFKGVRALLPKSDAVEVALGTVSFQEGNFQAAERHYRLALEANPRSAYAYAHLAESDIFQGKSDDARAHIDAAVKLDPYGVFGQFARNLMRLVDAIQSQQGVM